jgi:Vacuolar protein sorting-associated protein 62
MLGLMAALGPVIVHDSRETSPLGSAGERPGTFAAAPVVYERRAGDWQQWWLAFARNDQDRGIARTGRHAGDWELLQVRLDGRGQPVEAVYAQHSGAERCPWAAVEKRDGRPVAYLANCSHAAYFRPGVRDRMWPDPNDEADGRGEVIVPALEPLGAWAAAARPCTYDRCDEAGECDGRETAISFSAPVALALAAIAVLRRRSSRHVEHREP